MIDVNDPTLNLQLMQADSCFWAIQNRLKLLGGIEFTLDGCQYLADIMRSSARKKCVMKGAQARMTTAFMIESIHGLIYHRYPQGVIYYFPTEKSVEGFSKTRFGPLVDDNPIIKEHLKSTKSVSIKKVGKSFLSLLGAKATIDIQGKKDSTAVRSTPADKIVRDERDLFDDDMAEQTKQRLLNSKIKEEADIGTPTIPDWGVSKVYNNSTQNHWLVKCLHCNEYNCLEEEFPNCVKFKKGKPYFACMKCGRQIYPVNGEWVAKTEAEIEGWLVPHLITPNIDLPDVMRRWEDDQLEGKVGEFYNAILGLPYIAAEDKLTLTDVFACCGNDVMRTVDSYTGTAMGVDIGKAAHHVVIAEKRDDKRAKVVYLARVKGFDALHDIARKYNVKSAVIDLRPYEESFRKFQRAEPYKVFGCEYRDRMKQFKKSDEKEGIYSVNRTEMFDKTHFWIRNRQLELPRRCREVDEYAKQMCNCAKVLEENEQGDRIYRYRKLGDDHYRSATNYLYLALMNLHDYEARVPVPTGKKEEWNPLTWGL